MWKPPYRGFYVIIILMNLSSVKLKIYGFIRGFWPTRSKSVSLPKDWSLYFGQYESQKHDDLDSNCCWAYSGNEVIEDSLEYLWKTNKLSPSLVQWFKDNGYIDEDGDFYLSRRWIPIWSGVKRNGNDPANFWSLTKEYGAIPNSMLPYTNNIDYFDKAFVTKRMVDLGREFKRRINIEYTEVGFRFINKSIERLQSAISQSELQICIPVPEDVSKWNNELVKYDGGRHAQHAVALYKIDPTSDYPFFIYDQYQPMLKRLSSDYFIPIVGQPSISENIIGNNIVSYSVIEQFVRILKNLGLWTIKSIGGIIT